jgi:hypothetical protein
MPVSIRLDKESEEMLRKMADSLHMTKSDAVRNAIKDYGAKILEEKKKTPWVIYQTIHSPGGSGHGKRIHESKETLRKIMQIKRKKWSL